MEINQGYAIRRVIAFDNECGFVLGENPKAPDPYVTWQFNMRDGERNYFWEMLYPLHCLQQQVTWLLARGSPS